MNADKIFIDTNVLIYAFTSDEPDKQEITIKLIENCQPVVSTQVLREFSNVLLKKGNVSNETIKETISEITAITSVVDEDVSLILHAIDINARYKFSFYDSLIVVSALNSQCQVLLSEDMQDGQIIEGSLRIVSPFRGMRR